MADSSAEERTQAPTARRIQDARQSGQVAVSRDLVAALAIAVACVLFVATAQTGVAGLVQAMREAMAGAATSTAIAAAAEAGLEVGVLTVALPAGALFVVVCLASLAQTRGLASIVPLRPDAKRVMPSVDKVFGRERVIEAGKGLVVLGVLFVVAFWSLRPAVSGIAALGGASATQILRAEGILGEYLAIRLTTALLAFGAVDFLWQRHRHGKALRMSRDEVKREHRESEGEPAFKAERLRLHQQFMDEHALGDITEADLVVIHSGVTAVAIRYDGASSSAPVVMLKGERIRAHSIEDAARAAGVPVVADPDLVHALALVESGGEIPEALYEQVAECLVQAQAVGQPED
jgi:flagellar biosynthesis protein FlhB